MCGASASITSSSWAKGSCGACCASTWRTSAGRGRPGDRAGHPYCLRGSIATMSVSSPRVDPRARWAAPRLSPGSMTAHAVTGCTGWQREPAQRVVSRRYLAHERRYRAPRLRRLAVPARAHRARGLVVLPLRAQRPRRGGTPGRARGARERRDGPPVVPHVRAGRRQRPAPPSPAPWRYVASRRGLQQQQRGAARPLAGRRSGRDRAR